jgi:hypothetical protein
MTRVLIEELTRQALLIQLAERGEKKTIREAECEDQHMNLSIKKKKKIIKQDMFTYTSCSSPLFV